MKHKYKDLIAHIVQTHIFKVQFRNLSLYLLAAIFSSFIGVLINPFLAANLSHEDYAIIGYFTSFNLLVLPIVSFSLLSYYSRNYFRINEDERQMVLDTLLISQLVIGSFSMIFILGGMYIYMKSANVGFSFLPYSLLCFIPVFFNCFYNFLLIETRMKRQAKTYFRITILNALTGAVFALIFVVILKGGALGRFWAILIPSFAFGLYGFIRLFSSFNYSPKVFREALSFGWPISLSAILYYFLSGVDRALLEPLNDTINFGLYNVAIQIVAYLYIFYTALSNTFEPDIYKSIAENNRKKLLKIVFGIILLNAIPIIVFILLAQPLVKILTFGRYTEAAEFARILAVKNIPMSLCFLVSNIIIGFGYPKVELINRFFGAVISVITFKLLISRYGFLGAAWGHTIAFVMMTLISLIFVGHKYLSSGVRYQSKD